MVGALLIAGADSNVFSGGSLPYQRQRGNSSAVVVHSAASNTKNTEGERDTESITLDQFLNECNKSPKSRVCSLFRRIAEFCENNNTALVCGLCLTRTSQMLKLLMYLLLLCYHVLIVISKF